MVVVAESDPEVPVMVRTLLPPVAFEAAVKVSVLVPLVDEGENEAVTPVGRPEMESATVPVKPYSGCTATVVVPE
jgi:hypothetical protein